MRVIASALASCLACVGVLLAPAPARAADRPVALGPVSYDGEFPPYFQRELEQALADSLERAAGVVIELRVRACEQLDCLLEPAARAEAAIVILAHATEDNRNYRIELVAHAVDDGSPLATVEIDCRVCGQQELVDSIPAGVIELEAKIAEGLAARKFPPKLVVEGKPRRAALTLDGRDFGTSPTSGETTTGEHELEIAAPGHATQRHHWFAVSGVEEIVEYELAPLADRRSGTWIGGWVALSLGLAGTGAGVALIVLDGRDHGPTCSPGLVDVNGACPNVYTTAAAGVTGLGIGIAAVAAGAGLLIHARVRSRGRARTQVTASGLQVRF